MGNNFLTCQEVTSVKAISNLKMSEEVVQQVNDKSGAAPKKSEAKTKKKVEAKDKKKSSVKKSAKSEPKKMTYLDMVTEAIVTMKDRTGSSRKAIIKYIVETHKVEASKLVHVRKAIATGIEKGILKPARSSGKGAGSFRVVKQEKPVAKKSSKIINKNLQKKNIKRPVKTKAAKKDVAKKTSNKKSAAKAVKKPTAKKTADKKPAPSKKAAKPVKAGNKTEKAAKKKAK